MTEFKRNFYFADQAKSCETGGHKFQVWPGMVARINRFERADESEGAINYYDMPGMLLDTTSKVVRQQSCYEVIKTHKRTSKGDAFKKACLKDLVGSTILTQYNKENYRIDDIDFDNSPLSKFDKRGVETSYVEYYQTQYNIKIKDPKQPLFICRPKKKQAGEQRNISLIPELCMPTGLTDSMRTDFKIMRDLAQFTRLSPDDRYKRYQSTNELFQKNQQIKDAMKAWGIRFAKDGFAKATGFKIKPQDIVMSKKGAPTTQKGDEKADWDRALKSNSLLVAPPNLKKWVFLCANKKAEKEATEFVKCIVKTCEQQGWKVSKPKVEFCDDKVMVKQVRSYVDEGIEFMFCFVPRERKDHYDAVKKVCLQSGVASQFVKERTIKKNMQAVATKVALQMACKFGGEPWSVAMPPHINKKPVMYVGIDVYHDTAKKNDSVFGLVGSLNNRVTRWYSTHQILSQTEETPGQAVRQMIKLALGAYKAANGYLPGNIVIYRDGVGDTDLPRVKYQEIDTIKSELEKIAQNSGEEGLDEIKMTFCVVQKRIDHKMLAIKSSGCENPPAGTILDTVITKNIWYDFFLVSQLTRQGTVTPIHINVLHDHVGLPAEKLQLLTFKLCHLYYNWPGTVRVPAPVQYAHKYAQLIGDSVHAGVEVEASMKDKLFYL
jgi:aubergine-like protein